MGLKFLQHKALQLWRLASQFPFISTDQKSSKDYIGLEKEYKRKLRPTFRIKNIESSKSDKFQSTLNKD
jgi:hypothetical protein